MKCPHCRHLESKVVQTRDVDGAIRRRRQCLLCDKRFTTFERPERLEYFVVKADHRREVFDREKVLSGLKKACEKRPVSITTLEAITEDIVETIAERGEVEVPAKMVGELVMEHLYKVDQVAYVRFASVYRKFQDVGEFHTIIEQLQSDATRE